MAAYLFLIRYGPSQGLLQRNETKLKTYKSQSKAAKQLKDALDLNSEIFEFNFETNKTVVFT